MITKGDESIAAPRLHVKKIMSHENEAMTMLWKTGVCTTKQLEEHFNIKTPRLKKLCHSKYLKQSNGRVWLNKKGVKHLRRIGLDYQYKTSIRNIGHDLRLTEKYLSLNKATQQTWKTETQLRNEAKEHPQYNQFKQQVKILLDNKEQKKIHATPDAAIYSEECNGYVAIEITTRNYKDTDIKQKMEFAKTFLSGYKQD